MRSLLHGTAALLLLAACDSPTGGGDTEEPTVLTVTLDGSAGWAYADLDAASPAVSIANPATDTSWEIAVNASNVMLNGGAAGPGGVTGWCVCQNEAATNEQVMAFTAASQLAGFDAVTAASAPTAADAWASDALAPAISGWWSYNSTTHVVSADPSKAFYVRTAEGAAFAKLRVVSLADAQRAHAGKVTIEYAVQPSAVAALGETKQATIDVSGGRIYFDLVNGSVSTAADWDLALEGYDIRVNGGAAGPGGVTGWCVCQNEAATNEQVMAFTAA
ncbi:MAG TPA: HmuY family protein, partial [Longimicrobium sp.]|nr:HmuY family protein [Longimicrobium sp.]